MKHITIQAVNHPAMNKVMVRVVAQTHVGSSFSSREKAPYVGGFVGYDTRKFISSTGIILASNKRPARDSKKTAEGKNTIWLKGNGTVKENANTVVMSKATFERFTQAVLEYNEYYKAAAPAPRQAVSDCSFVVG